MPASRLKRTPEQVREQYAAARSMSQFCKLLKFSYNPGGAERLCLDNGLDYPAAHWGEQGVEIGEATAAEAVDSDLATERAEREAKTAEALYREARRRLLDQDDLLAAVIAAGGKQLDPPGFVVAPPKTKGLPKRSVVVHISDWQGGQKVSAVDTGGNVYDWDIMLSRMDRFLNGVVGSIRNLQRAYEITSVTLAYGGDMLEGMGIFKGQAYQLCKDIGAQAVEGALAWAAWERRLRAELPGVAIRRRRVGGNHGIPGGRNTGAITSTANAEMMFHALLDYDTASLAVDAAPYRTDGRDLFEVAGHAVLLTHGDEVRGQMGIPFYGIRTGWMKHTQEVGMFRYWLFAHIHQTSLVTYGDGAALSNGDAVGYNNLTGKLRNPSSTPQQSVYFFSRERGLDEVSYIHLVDKVAA